jgi:NAD(P)-dependent dehydrogenase (short-subunit alcohol dehydrogenase family)
VSLAHDTFNGKKAIVTGGTRGIGRAISHALAKSGCDVIYTGRTDPEPLPSGQFFSADFHLEADVRRLRAFIADSKPDILINNAGINKIGPFCDIKMEDFDDVININLRVPFQLIQSALPHMSGRGWGRIVNISSIFGVISKEFRASYSASKFALDGMTAAVSAEFAKKGVLINNVCPGFVRTELTKEILGDVGMQQIAKSVPINRLAEPSEIANAVLWLCSPDNSFMSGQSVVVDGGFVRV